MKNTILSLLLLLISFNMVGQKEKVAVISIETKDMSYDNEAMANLVRIELEKTNLYDVYDKYDVMVVLQENEMVADNCLGKTNNVFIGKKLGSDKMISGSVQKIGNNIIYTLRLIDVQQESTVTTTVMEYVDEESEIQTMTRITINELLGIPNDQTVVDLLQDYDQPITSAKNTLRLNGPRMGVTITTGLNGEILRAPKSQGGFDANAVTSMFGYQFEWQYLGSGDFQVLLETIVALNGIESGMLIPSLSFLNGFRFNRSGWEIGLGPTFRIVKQAKGYYDENDNWHLIEEMEEGQNYETYERLDSRGSAKLNLGLIVAVGKTFRSGRLNMPLNLYWTPRKNGDVIGISLGFNVASRSKKNNKENK